MLELKLLYPHPALLIRNGKNKLVISDLHIGFEDRFNSKGISIPPSTSQMLKELGQLVRDNKIDQLIILGDVKYTVEKISKIEWNEVPRFFEEISKLTHVKIISGNHDGGLAQLLPRNIELSNEHYLVLEDTVLLHGHTKPPRITKNIGRVIMGHLHPTYSRSGSAISGKQVWLILRVNGKVLFPEVRKERLEIYVLPSFNRDLAPLGFTSNKGRINSPIIRRLGANIIKAAIVTIEGDIIGDAESLPFVL